MSIAEPRFNTSTSDIANMLYTATFKEYHLESLNGMQYRAVPAYVSDLFLQTTTCDYTMISESIKSDDYLQFAINDDNATIRSFTKSFPEIYNLLSNYSIEEKLSKQIKLFGDFIFEGIYKKEYNLIDTFLKVIDSSLKLNDMTFSNGVLLTIISLSAHIKSELGYWESLYCNVKKIFILHYGEEKTSNMLRGVEA